MEIRSVTLDDAEQISKIYSYYVNNTAISFEYVPPSAEEIRSRIVKTVEKYPYVVATQDNAVIGYAYAGPFVGRAAYDRSAALSMYLSQEAKGKGIGRKLYEELESQLREMNVTNAYACIAYPIAEDEYLTVNSAEFHHHLGFEKVGEFHKCAYKFGRWYDMIWMEKIIGKHTPITEE